MERFEWKLSQNKKPVNFFSTENDIVSKRVSSLSLDGKALQNDTSKYFVNYIIHYISCLPQQLKLKMGTEICEIGEQ